MGHFTIVPGERKKNENCSNFQISGSRSSSARFDKKIAECSKLNLLFISNESIKIRLMVNVQIETTNVEIMYKDIKKKYRH